MIKNKDKDINSKIIREKCDLKIVDFFKRIFGKKDNKQLLNATETRYQELVESIDDLELCKMFVERTTRNVTPEMEKAIQPYQQYQQAGNRVYEYPVQTTITKDDTFELARKFFECIDDGLCEKFNNIINGNNPNIILVMEEFNGKRASTTNPNEMPVTVYVPIRDDIRQLYELVHECTHTFDIDNGDTPTRMVLGEVAPQCMERLLDDFLLEMSDEDMQRYGFEKSTIEKDVKTRRIATFLSRFNNAQNLYRRCGEKKIDSRYMLAQIYSAHFNKFDKKVKKNKLVSFIEYVKNDEFDKANSCFELSISKSAKLNGFYRDTYVGDAISEVKDLVLPQNQEDSKTQPKELDRDDLVR